MEFEAAFLPHDIHVSCLPDKGMSLQALMFVSGWRGAYTMLAQVEIRKLHCQF